MDENATRLWLNGYILIGTSTRIPVQEVSVDLSRDLKEYYSAGSPDASALIPGQNKIEFSIKRVFNNTVMAQIYLKRCSFQMILYNNSSEPTELSSGEAVCTLSGCMLSKDSIGTLGNGEAVTEDISGSALSITFNIEEIAQMINPLCENL